MVVVLGLGPSSQKKGGGGDCTEEEEKENDFACYITSTSPGMPPPSFPERGTYVRIVYMPKKRCQISGST